VGKAVACHHRGLFSGGDGGGLFTVRPALTPQGADPKERQEKKENATMPDLDEIIERTGFVVPRKWPDGKVLFLVQLGAGDPIGARLEWDTEGTTATEESGYELVPRVVAEDAFTRRRSAVATKSAVTRRGHVGTYEGLDPSELESLIGAKREEIAKEIGAVREKHGPGLNALLEAYTRATLRKAGL
jgi:hypothetical protein